MGHNTQRDACLLAGLQLASTFCHMVWQTRSVLRNVAVLVLDGVAPFDLGVLCEAFGVDRSDHGIPTVDFAVSGVERGRIRTTTRFTTDIQQELARLQASVLYGTPAIICTHR